MPGYGVIPSIRVRDLPGAVAFYTSTLGFSVDRPDDGGGNTSLTRGDARIMLELGTSNFYSERYNEEIRRRLERPGAMALYIEAEDLEELATRSAASGAEILDPLAARPWGQAEFTVADPEGNLLTFWKAPPADAT